MCAYAGKKVVDTVRQVLDTRAELREIVRDHLKRGRAVMIETEVHTALRVLDRNGDERGLALLEEVMREVNVALDREEWAKSVITSGT